MFKIQTSGITSTAAMPLKKGTIDHLQNGIISGDVALIRSQIGASYSTSNIYVVYGLDRTVAGSVHTFTDGVVLYNNQLYAVTGSAITLTSGWYINLTLANAYLTLSGYDPTQFSDGSFKNIHEVHGGTLAQSATPSNESNTWIYLNKVYFASQPTPVYGGATLNSLYNGTLAYSLKNQVLTISGMVYGLTGASSGDILFTLPVGYRPSVAFNGMAVLKYNETIVNLSIATNGQVSISNISGGGSSFVSKYITISTSIHIY
jgi:hypothetical protein